MHLGGAIIRMAVEGFYYGPTHAAWDCKFRTSAAAFVLFPRITASASAFHASRSSPPCFTLISLREACEPIHQDGPGWARIICNDIRMRA